MSRLKGLKVLDLKSNKLSLIPEALESLPTVGLEFVDFCGCLVFFF